MRRFEFVEGSSSKFWEVEVNGESLTVRYGKIGSTGQTQTKTFASPAKAQAEHDKLVREKTGKGYVEQGVSGAGVLAPVAPKAAAPAPATAPVPVAAIAADLKTTDLDPPRPAERGEGTGVRGNDAPASAGTDPGPEPQPPGAFLWTSHWRKVLVPFVGESGAFLPHLEVDACAKALNHRIEALRESMRTLTERFGTNQLSGPVLALKKMLAGVPADLRDKPLSGPAWQSLFENLTQYTQVNFGTQEPPRLQHSGGLPPHCTACRPR